MSWALSCLQLNKYYDDLHLYADSVSARTLIDELQLPYHQVHCELDKLNKFDSRLWALPKIYAYSMQEEAFLHVDADVFIWKPFTEELLSSGLIAQNLELVNNYYENIIRNLEGNLKFFPRELLNEMRPDAKFYAYNAGIFGGNDIEFFKEYTSAAFDFITKNTECFDRIEVGDFNVVYEQYLFYLMVKDKNKDVGVLFSELYEEYRDFGDFIEVPHNKQYLHLLGRYKQHKFSYEQLADRLRLDYPEYYYRIIALFKSNNQPLKKNYYLFSQCTTEEDFVKQYRFLKESYKNDSLAPIQSRNRRRILQSNGFRTELVKQAVDKMVSNTNKTIDNYRCPLKDIEIFENDIDNVLSTTFSKYSSEYLYGRDINSTEYFQALFGNAVHGKNTQVTTDQLYRVIESEFDWTEIDLDEYGQMILFEQLELTPSKYYTAVVPEWDSVGYSIFNIDELDLNILKLCENPTSINNVLKKSALLFDPIDIEQSGAEFEELIMGRIKKALKSKIIRII